MKKLVPLESQEYFSYFIQILKQKRKVKDILTEMQDTIELRYQRYCENKEDLSVIEVETFTQDQKKALLHCYEVSTKALESVKKQISELQEPTVRGKCQYCGIGVPTTFDHYMPKGIFPEYSVLPINLVPCCYECNNIRGENWLLENKQRMTVNLYFDDLLMVKCLFSEISYSDNIPETNFQMWSIDPSANNQSFEQLKRHYSMLDLEKRYKLQAAGVISETKRSIVIHTKLPCSREEIKQWLLDEARAKSDTFGINYWEASLMEGLANCDRFLQECLTEICNKS